MYKNSIGALYSLSNFKVNIRKRNKTNISVNKEEYNKIVKFIKDNSIKYYWREGFMPSVFDNIKPKPFLVYLLWNSDILEKNWYKYISIVWPRKPTKYAVSIIEKLIKLLSEYNNVVTVSWLAVGIDSLVHNLSIKYNIPTIAVLWWGIGRYLKNSKDKILKIVNRWWLAISEFKLFQSPERYTFPQRNRIIAWLGDLVFVPEAWENSGSLITVDFAIKFWKSVYWCPNNIFVLESKGINKYIAKWKIKPVYDIKEFVENIFGKPQKSNIDFKLFDNLDNVDIKIVDAIKNWYDTVNKIAVYIWISPSQLLSKLTMLEIKGIIKQDSPWFYKLN